MTEIGGKPAAKGIETRLVIAKDGAVSGTGGCNRVATRARIKGEAISFEPAAATMMMCDDKAMQQERAFFNGLEKTKSWRRDGATLILLDASAKPLMQFTQATGE